MEFKHALQEFTLAACDLLETNEALYVSIATQDWFRITRRNWNSYELIGETRVNFESLAEVVVAGTNLAASIDGIVTAIAAEAGFAERVLTYSDGGLVPDQPLQRRIHVGRVIASPFLARYLSSKGTAEFDDVFFETTFQRALDDLSNTVTEVRLLVPLTNAYLQATQYLLGPDIKLRELTNAELEEWFNTPRGAASPHGDRPVVGKELMRLNCGIEVTYRQPACQPGIPEPLAYATKLLTAFHLAAGGEVCAPFVQKQYLDCLLPVRTIERAEPVVFAREPVGCGPKTMRQLRQLWGQMQSATGLSWLQIALRRWDMTALRTRNDDRLIDYWVALESLFLREWEQSKRNNVAVRVAVWLSDDATDRAAICDAIWDSYGCRSSVVHADEKQLGQYNVDEVADGTREYLRQSLIKSLSTGKFDPAQLTDPVLQSRVKQRTKAAKQQGGLPTR